MTPEKLRAVNKVAELVRTTDLTYKQVSFVVERDCGIKLAPSTIGDIKLGYLHKERITVTDEAMENISKLIDGEGEYKSRILSRLEKLSIVEQLESHTPHEVIEHFNGTINVILTEESLEVILEEVNRLIEGNELVTEDELWFKSIILAKRK